MYTQGHPIMAIRPFHNVYFTILSGFTQFIYDFENINLKYKKKFFGYWSHGAVHLLHGIRPIQ